MWWWLNRWVHDLKRTEKYLHQTTWLWCLQAQACFGWVGVGSTVEARSWRARWHLWPSLTHTCVLLLASSSGSYSTLSTLVSPLCLAPYRAWSLVSFASHLPQVQTHLFPSNLDLNNNFKNLDNDMIFISLRIKYVFLFLVF